MILNWAIALLAYYLMVLAFFPDAQPIWAIFGLGMAAFGGAVPSAPGAVGTFEGAVVVAGTTTNTSGSLYIWYNSSLLDKTDANGKPGSASGSWSDI